MCFILIICFDILILETWNQIPEGNNDEDSDENSSSDVEDDEDSDLEEISLTKRKKLKNAKTVPAKRTKNK